MLFPLSKVDGVQFCLRKPFHRHWIHCPDLVEARNSTVRKLDASQQPWKTALQSVQPSGSQLYTDTDIQDWFSPIERDVRRLPRRRQHCHRVREHAFARAEMLFEPLHRLLRGNVYAQRYNLMDLGCAKSLAMLFVRIIDSKAFSPFAVAHHKTFLRLPGKPLHLSEFAYGPPAFGLQLPCLDENYRLFSRAAAARRADLRDWSATCRSQWPRALPSIQSSSPCVR